MPTTTVVTSKKFTLNLSDWWKGLIMAVGAPVIAIIQQSLNAGSFTVNWKTVFTVSLSAALIYLGKNFFDKPRIVVTDAPAATVQAVIDGDKEVKITNVP